MKNYDRYSVGYFPPATPHNEWVKKDHVEKAPTWCSVDLRDGNQALIVPMSLEEKVEFFQYLVKLGFKEIEVGFPAASETEYHFLRKLVDDNLIPDDVTIQVLTQSRKHIIKKTFDSLAGVKKAVVHLYNSTSAGTERAGIPQRKTGDHQDRDRRCTAVKRIRSQTTRRRIFPSNIPLRASQALK